jgi:high-affinity K+ transport system ATPase subunit B
LEKGGKRHEVPAHHNAEAYLDAYRSSGSVRVVAADDLRIGEAILVAPGGRIPVDGTVASGVVRKYSRLLGNLLLQAIFMM